MIPLPDHNRFRIPVYAPFTEPLPLPATDAPDICIPLNKALVPYIMGALAVYLYEDAWNTSDRAAADVAIKQFQGVLDTLAALNGDCADMPYQIRQPEDEPCIIEASTDGGDTWAEVVNLDNCPTPVQFRQNIEQPCNLEFSPNRGEAWLTVANLQLCPPRLRWRGGVLEYTVDDGDTWEVFETIDPLYDDPPPARPRPEEPPDDPRCSSAASATYAYMDLANRLFDILNRTFPPAPFSVAADFAGVTSNALNFFMTSDIFSNLVANAGFQLQTLGYLDNLYASALINSREPYQQLAVDLGLTDIETRERLKCALYCITGSAGTIPPDDVAAALDDAIANNDLAPGWTAFVALFGAGGVNAAASVPAISVPASDCDCDCPEEWCHVINLALSDGDFTPNYPSAPGEEPTGVWVSGSGWRGGYRLCGLGACRYIQAGRQLDFAPTVTSIKVWFSGQNYDPPCPYNQISVWGVVFGLEGDNPATISFEPTEMLDNIQLFSASEVQYCTGGGSGSNLVIEKLELRGVGINPFETNNCEEE